MKNFPLEMIGLKSLLLHVLSIPPFWLLFLLLYRSEWMLHFLNLDRGLAIFNMLMLTCILLGVLCASRIPMTVLRRRLHLNWTYYILWTLAEMVVAAFFMGLYMALMSRGLYHYFVAVGWCMLLLLSVVVYPYLTINLLVRALIQPEPDETEQSLIRFVDNTQRLKLVIAARKIVWIEANENYVLIHYMENERMRTYSLRNSMRSIEESLQRHAIVRCHRSYYVNPAFVKVLRRDKEGVIQAELDIPDMQQSITVSPRYYDDLNKLL